MEPAAGLRDNRPDTHRAPLWTNRAERKNKATQVVNGKYQHIWKIREVVVSGRGSAWKGVRGCSDAGSTGCLNPGLARLSLEQLRAVRFG